MDLFYSFFYFFPMLTMILLGIGAALFVGGYIRKLINSRAGSAKIMSVSSRQKLA